MIELKLNFDIFFILKEETGDGLNREKRKLVEPVLQSKNAILGFVFGVRCSS